jgi:predicted CXXCH cytochrome family protein
VTKTSRSAPAKPVDAKAAPDGSEMRSTPRWTWLLAVCVGAALLATLGWQVVRTSAPRVVEAGAAPAAPVAAQFVGSEACKGCHAAESAAWSSSQHARAMQHATAQTVRGDFNDARFVYQGVTSTFFTRDGRFFVRTDGPDGKLADFEVKYTFGVEPLQQYLVELPGGRLQALAVTWDTRPKQAGGQRWFRQYPNERIDSRDELHWTKRAQNWNFMCADCHSTQVVKGYDAATDAFKTKFNEISVGCESCHGPGSAHIAWARHPGADAAKGLTVPLSERRDVLWRIDPATGTAQRSREPGSQRELEVCAQCHARRAQIAEGYQAGAPFLDHYLPSLIVPDLYYSDGQQRDEVFIWGSWLQSRMHRKGVTCSDCHDPHTSKLRAEGNAVCGQCHAPGKYEATAHHRHAAGSAGAQCVACHMPTTTYMVVDPRRDHSMRVPRPDQSVALGVPNACTQCHTTRDARWAAGAVRGWLGRDAQGFQQFAPTFDAAERHRPGAIASLAAIANDVAAAPIVRASAVERMALAGGRDTATAQRAAQDAQPLVRLAAVRLAETLPASAQLRVLAPLLADPLRAIRIEAARALAGQQDGLAGPQREAWQRAADEYLATLQYTADRPEARVALGSFKSKMGLHEQAQQAYAAALQLDPDFVPAVLNAADDWRAQGNEAQARAALEGGLARAPKNAALHHAFGLALIRAGDRKRALPALERAAQLAPDEPRYTYVYAVALHSTGRPADAIKALDRATARWPGDRDLLMALATMQRDAGQVEAARRTATKLAQAFPDDPEVSALSRQLR